MTKDQFLNSWARELAMNNSLISIDAKKFLHAFYNEVIGYLQAKSKEEAEKIEKIISVTEDEHPYKEAGNPDSYSSYNEGWTDACDILGERILTIFGKEDEG